MKCNVDYYKYFFKRNDKSQPFTANQLDQLKDLNKQQLSKYIGLRSYLDQDENRLLAQLANIKNQQFAVQSQKGQPLSQIQQYAKNQADAIASTMHPDDAQSIFKAGEDLLLSRKKGQVFSMAEKELITPVFVSAMNNLPLLSKQITRMLDEGNDTGAALLTVELNKTMAKVAAFYGDVNATSNALRHLKKINADIKNGREISAAFATGGC